MADDLTFVQLADPHLLASASRRLRPAKIGSYEHADVADIDDASRAIDPTANFKAVMGLVRAMARQPDFILISGDLADKPEVGAYEQFKSLLQTEFTGLTPIVAPALGNHDGREQFRRVVLGETTNLDQPHYTAHLVGGVRVITLDSHVPGGAHGWLDEAQLRWLDATLADSTPGGAVIHVHHNVVPAGYMRFIEANMILKNADQLAAVIANRGVLGVLTGHIHLPSQAVFAGTLTASAPAISYLIDPFTRDAFNAQAGFGFNVGTVRDGRLTINPVVVPDPPMRNPWRLDEATLEARRRAAG